MKRKSVVLMFFFLFAAVFLWMATIGKILDATDRPQVADLIVCLGGGTGYRVQKSLELYKKGLSQSGKIAVTSHRYIISPALGIKDKIDYLKEGGVRSDDIVHLHLVTDTMQEVKAVKTYMLQHGMKSVIFVSNSFHSLRIKFLANVLDDYKEDGLHAMVVASQVPWLSTGNCCDNAESFKAAIDETIKFPYDTIKYGLLYDLFENYESLTPVKKMLIGWQDSIKRMI